MKLDSNLDPIFIIGVGRSGTSLLQSMLNSHSKIAFTPETHFIRSYMSSNIDIKRNSEKILIKIRLEHK